MQTASGFAGHVNYVQELTIEVHNQTDNVFTTWDKYKVVKGNLQSNIVNEERYCGKKSLLEVTDMPIPVQIVVEQVWPGLDYSNVLSAHPLDGHQVQLHDAGA